MKYRNPKLKKRLALRRKMESYKKRLKPPTDNASPSPNPLLLDPTRTQTLRRSFGSKVNGVFAQLGKRIAEYLIGEDPLGLADREDQLAIVNAFCATGQGGGVDPSCGKGKGGSSRRESGGDSSPTASLQSRTTGQMAAGILKAGAKLGAKALKKGVQVAPGVIKESAKLLTKAVKAAYDRYGDKGSLCTLGLAFSVFANASGIATGGASIPAALVAGLVFVEARNGLKWLVEKAELGTDNSKLALAGKRVNNAEGEEDSGLADHILHFLKEFARTMGVAEPELDKEEVQEMIDRMMEHLEGKTEPVGNVFCPTGEGGGIDPSCSKHQVSTREESTGNRTTVRFELAGDPRNHLRASLRPNALRIKHVFVGEGDRGQGIGMALYQSAIRYAEARDIPLESDEFVAADAVKVWQALERRGYPVTRHEATPDSGGGLNAKEDKGPVFSLKRRKVNNVFCPTGEGGGVDPSCSPGAPKYTGDPTGVYYVSIKKLFEHGEAGQLAIRYTERELRALAEDIKKNGLREPILMLQYRDEDPETARTYVSGGRNRIEAAKIAGFTHVPVRVTSGSRRLGSRFTANVFCPTGEGGGIDPSCSLNQTLLKELEKIVHDPKTKAADRRKAMVKLSKLRDELEASGAAQPKAERDEDTQTLTLSSVEGKARDLASKANYGYVKVADLWKALGSPPLSQFHAALQQLWKNGVLRLQEHEGRHGISDEEQSTALQVTGYHSDRATRFTGFTVNIFCATGEGGGIDPTCLAGERRDRREGRRQAKREARAEAVADMQEGGIKGFFKRLFGGGKKAEKAVPQPTNPSEDYLDRGALNKGRMVRIKDKFDEVSDKVPGVKKTKAAVSTLFKGIHGRLEQRYGTKVANTIMISGPAGGYGVMAGAIALTGTPGIPIVNDLVSIAAQTAVAELGLQSGRLYKRFSVGRPAVANEGTEVDLSTIARQVAEEIREGLARIAEEHREELEQALSRPEVKRLVDEVHMDSVRNSSPDQDEDELVGNAIFGTSTERLSSFQTWLEGQLQHLVLSQQQRDLWNRYIQEGFEKGAGRSYEDVTGRRYDAPTDAGSTEEFLRTSFANPQRKERLELVASRTFDEVKNLTEDMKNRLARVLANALVAGQSPREAAKDLATELNISRERALLIAQTELIRAHAEGQLTALEALGVPEVGALVEWTVTDDQKLCPRCRKMAGVVLKTSEARGLIPLHPRCRCAWIPAGLGEPKGRQKTTKRDIERAASAADVEVEVGIRPRMRRPVQNTYRTANFQTIDLDALTLEDVKELLAGNARSFFADCNRDSHGYCLPDWTVLVKDEKEETKELSFKFSGVKAVKRARTIALERANSNPKPTLKEVKQANRKMDEKGAADYESDIRGNSVSRKASRQRLLKDFGNGTHCPCIYCGAQLDETTVTRDKILTARQGGRYRNENLVPACLACNKSRGDLAFNDIKWSKLKERPTTNR